MEIVTKRSVLLPAPRREGTQRIIYYCGGDIIMNKELIEILSSLKLECSNHDFIMTSENA